MQAAKDLVMTDDGHAACGLADVELKPVAAMLQAEIERGQGVFRDGGCRSCATVAE